VELAAWLLKLAGVDTEVKKEGGRDEWRIDVTTNRLAAGREELRKALAEIVKTARENRWIDAGKTEQWLEELERGRVLKEGWPKLEMRLKDGALVVRYRSPNPGNIEREAQRFRKMGLKRGVHFSVKTPEEGREGYVSILRRGLAYAAWLSVHGSGDQHRLAADFVEYILRRAEEEGDDVYEKAKEIVDEGKARGSLKLEDFEKKVEVNGKTYVVKVIGGEAVEEDRGGRKLLRIRITAEVGGVRGEYTITYSRRGANNAAVGFATASGGTPSDGEADAERIAAVVEALTGRKPRIIVRSNGKIELMCGREHLEGFKRYAELTDAIEKWLEETGLR
jgi:ParB-like chromosome segregation protein Spo0J